MLFRVVLFLVLSLLISSNVWSENSMGTLVVRPEYKSGSIEKYSQSVEVYDSEYISRRNVSDVFELLHRVAGLNVKSDGKDGNASSLFMRGGASGTEVAVFVDGINITDPVWKTPRLSIIPVSSIERVEVVRGGASALYGEDAMSGVVNIITKKNASGLIDISYSKGGSDFSEPNIAFYKGAVFGDWSASFGVERGQYFGDRKENDESDTFSTNTSVTYAKSDFEGTVKYFRYFNDLYYHGSTTPGSEGHSHYTNYGLSFKTVYKKFSLGLDNNTYRYRDLSGWGSRIFQQSLYANYSFKFYGSDDYSVGVKSFNLNDKSNKWKNHEDSYKFTSTYRLGRFEIIPAYRYVDNDEFGSESLHSFGLNYYLFDNVAFKFMNAKSYNNPLAYEYSKKVSNLDSEIVYENNYGLDFYGEDCLFNFTIFNKNYLDMIVNTGGWYPFDKYENIKKAKVNGFEIKYELFMSSFWDVMLSYTQINLAENTSDESGLVFVPEKELVVDNIVGTDDFNCYITYRYKGDFGEDTNWDGKPDLALGDVALWDTGVNVNPFYVKVTNLFDKGYVSSKGYPAEGIRWTLGAKTEF